MEIASVVLLGFTAILLLMELKLTYEWFQLKLNKPEVWLGELSGIYQRHDLSAQYFVKIKNKKFDQSLKIKTGIISSLFPRLLGREFKIIFNEKEDKCFVNNILFYLFGNIISVLLFIFAVSFLS